MSNRNVPFNTTVEEMDNLIFRVLGNTFAAMYPNDGRMAIKSAMHACDKVVEELEALVAKQAKSAQARAAAQARYNNPATAQATQSPATPETAPQPSLHALAQAAHPAPKPARVRRTKAQIAAGVPLAAVAASAPTPQPVPMGQPFSEPFPQAPGPVQAAPQPAPATQPEPPPVVSDFATLARQGVPQFAPPGATPNPAFVPPAPTFG